MNRIKIKIVGIDQLSQSLLVSFSPVDQEPDDTKVLAFQPHFFGDMDRDAIINAIAASGVSLVQSQQTLEDARSKNKVALFDDLVGQTQEVEINLPEAVATVNSEDDVKIKIREVLMEEGLIQ